jgi:hypothetical protein
MAPDTPPAETPGTPAATSPDTPTLKRERERSPFGNSSASPGTRAGDMTRGVALSLWIVPPQEETLYR